ncbi:DNA-binding protein [Streptomyces sp. SM12]|uniref:telomere-protecting terminal protein Tpg n=1 Tax=Streptomyces sp. SM12 TaxID=1071602 RepID=UPI000CD57FD6|nr:DNA-binding protein [Streptomyces sp. SM12]
MGEIQDAVARALAAVHTRPVPQSAQARMRALHKAERGSSRAVAARLGTTPRTVQRYLTGEIRRPGPALAAALDREVRRVWQPRVRARAIRAAAAAGVVIETRARFGFTAAPGSTDDARLRLITQRLSPGVSGRLLEAADRGAPEADLRRMVGDGLGESYFRDGGRRAAGLDVEVTEIDYLDVDL